jgi:hypothetical protein
VSFNTLPATKRLRFIIPYRRYFTTPIAIKGGTFGKSTMTNVYQRLELVNRRKHNKEGQFCKGLFFVYEYAILIIACDLD